MYTMAPRHGEKRQMTEHQKIVALTNLEDGWKIQEEGDQCPGSAGGGEETLVYGDSGGALKEAF